MAPRPDHRVRTNDAVACQRDPVRALHSTRTRSRDRPRRRGVAADRHCSRTTRAAYRGARRRNCTTTTASVTTPPREAAWTPAEDPGTTTGVATTGGHPDRPDDAPT